MNSAITYITFSLCTVYVAAYGQKHCASTSFSGSDTDTGIVHCGPRYHECSDNEFACCPDIAASPVQLALVIMGPISMALSFGLLGFVIYICVGVIREDKEKASSAIRIESIQH